MINFSPKELNNDNWSNKKTKQSNYRLHSKSLEIKKKNFFSQKAVFCVCVCVNVKNQGNIVTWVFRACLTFFVIHSTTNNEKKRRKEFFFGHGG